MNIIKLVALIFIATGVVLYLLVIDFKPVLKVLGIYIISWIVFIVLAWFTGSASELFASIDFRNK